MTDLFWATYYSLQGEDDCHLRSDRRRHLSRLFIDYTDSRHDLVQVFDSVNPAAPSWSVPVFVHPLTSKIQIFTFLIRSFKVLSYKIFPLYLISAALGLLPSWAFGFYIVWIYYVLIPNCDFPEMFPLRTYLFYLSFSSTYYKLVTRGSVSLSICRPRYPMPSAFLLSLVCYSSVIRGAPAPCCFTAPNGVRFLGLNQVSVGALTGEYLTIQLWSQNRTEAILWSHQDANLPPIFIIVLVGF